VDRSLDTGRVARSRLQAFADRRRRRRRQRVVAAGVLVSSAVLALISSLDANALAAVGLGPSTAPAAVDSPASPSGAPSPLRTHMPTGCEITGTAQRAVEGYLATRTAEFGAVTVDGRNSAGDCVAIRAFQTWAGMQGASGIADSTTGSVARRLTAAAPGHCHAGAAMTVCVNLSQQILWVQRSGVITFGPVPIRTGRAGEATPPGTYAITEKKADTTSSEFGTKLPFWQRFYRDYGFHAAETYLYADIPGSHGCVNLLLRDAKALFGLTGTGTAVRIFGVKPGT
jgi:lipoprotein-anchoring transpeptidase ErfK/SrfK